jgi:capsular polysaccharide biosynthesis protein
MTVDSRPIAGDETARDGDVETFRIVSERVVSLATLLTALRRRRAVWIALGVLGLLIGAAYHIAVPVKYDATSTLYLAHPSGTDSTTVAQNDLAMLNTAAVAEKAIHSLGAAGKGLTPKSFLGKTPGTITSGNVLTLTISGPTSAVAVHRVDALARSYLAFRAQLYREQNRAYVAATEQQISRLQAEVTHLNARIAALGKTGHAVQLADLQQERAAATTQVSQLQQSIAQTNLSTLAVVNGSRVITPGTPAPTSVKKAFIEDSLGAMGAGLALGAFGVAVAEVLSDRVRRREDLAALLGAPVGVSVGRLRGRRRLKRTGLGRRRALLSGRSSDPPVRIAAQYLRDRLMARGPKGTELVVAADGVTLPAAAVLLLARTLAGSGDRVIVVDETKERTIARAVGVRTGPIGTVDVGDGHEFSVLVPERPWEGDQDLTSQASLGRMEELAGADAVLVIATIDPGLGAWHLRRWSADAILTVTAGASTTHHLAAVAELLGAAGVVISSAILANTDARDDSAGLPATGPSATGRRLSVVASTSAAPGR